MLRIIEITDYNELISFSSKWEKLLASSELNNIFLTWEWLSTWVETYIGSPNGGKSGARRLRVLLAYDGEELVGIAPLYIEKTNAPPGIPLNRLGLLGDRWVGSDRLGFIIARKKEYACVFAFLDHIYKMNNWHLASFHALPPESILFDAFMSYFDDRGKPFSICNYAVSPCIYLNNQKDPLSRLSQSTKKNLKWSFRKIASNAVHLDYADAFETLPPAFDALVSINTLRMAQKGINSTLTDESFQSFHLRIMRLLEKNNWLRLNFLLFNGDPVAAFYGFSYNRRYYYYLGGIKTSPLSKYSPGVALFYRNIENARVEKCTEFDFLRGNEPYKLKWATHLRRTLSLEFLRPGLGALAHLSFTGLKNFLKYTLR